MSFVTDNDLTTVVVAALKKSLADLTTLANGDASYWPTLISDANLAAYNEIVGRLVARGYLKTQIDTWDRGVEVQKKIGLYWSLVEGGALDGFDDKWTDKLERYFLGPDNVLDTCVLTANGIVLDPAGSPGTIGTGALNTDQDMFVMPTSETDGRIGQETKW